MLPDSGILKDHSKKTEIQINQQRRQTQKFEFFLNCFDFLTDNEISGDYFEFGCHRARTFRMALSAARFYNLNSMKFHAFDSFEGLPDIGRVIINKWAAGELCTGEEEFNRIIETHGLFTDSIFLHKGFYSDLLTSDLQNALIKRSTKASFVNIDCDFYESAKDVFNFLEPFLSHGSIIYIDDYFGGFTKTSNGGVMQAFDEFMSTSDYHFIEHMTCGWWGKSFLTIA